MFIAKSENFLTRLAFKNAIFSFANQFIPIIISIFLTPFLLKNLGESLYGFYTLVITILGFLALIEVSLSWYVVKNIASLYAADEMTALGDFFSAIKPIYSILAILGSLILLFLALFHHIFFNHLFAAFRPDIFFVLLLGGIYYFIKTYYALYFIIPPALQRFDISAKISLTQIILTNIGFVVVVSLGWGLPAIMALNIIAILGLVLFFRAVFYRLLPGLKMKRIFNPTTIFNSVNFSLFAVVNVLLFSDLTRMDKLLTPFFSDPKEYIYYTIPNTIAQKELVLIASLATVLFPLVSALFTAGNMEMVKHMFRRSLRILSFFAGLMSIVLIIYADKILRIWLGDQTPKSGIVVLIVLAGAYFFLSLINILYNFLIGLNRVKVVAFSGLLIILFNFILTLILAPIYGIIGTALAWLITLLLATPIIFYWAEKRIMKLSDTIKFYGRLFLRLGIVAAIVYFFSAIFLLPVITNLQTLLAGLFFSSTMFIVIYVIMGFVETEDRQIFIFYFKKIKAYFC